MRRFAAGLLLAAATACARGGERGEAVRLWAFGREGEALVMDLPVSIPDAVLGGKVEARTPDGAVTLTVPKGANSGQSLRLKGKGLSDSRGKRGDLLARIVLMLPDKPDQELEGFAERWRKERPYTPRKK